MCMTEKEIAWLAGLFEGEGCVSYNSANSVRLIIGMTCQDVVERIRQFTGVGNIYTQTFPPDQNRKTVYRWEVGIKAEVEELICLLLPWMGERRAKNMKEALIRLEANRGNNRPIEHGTRKGYRTEQWRDIAPCVPCREAHLQYYKDRNASKPRGKNA